MKKLLTIFFLGILITTSYSQNTVEVYFAGKKKGVIKKENAIQIDSLEISDYNYKIEEFSMVVAANGTLKLFSSKGPILTKEMKEFIKFIPKKGEILFSDIVVSNNKIETIDLPTLSFRIK